jgi:(p)ppGpp synthase/HD superfamily hydrolase
VRKGGDIPYVGHLLTVAGLVINDGGSEAQAIAALLHPRILRTSRNFPAVV